MLCPGGRQFEFISSIFACMYTAIQLAVKWVQYYINASNGKGHGVHSPFVFEFIQNVLSDKRVFYAYEAVEEVRSQLLQNSTLLTLDDYGAGSTIYKSNTRKVQQIAATSLKPKKWAQLLFRIVNFYQVNTIIELGTSLGITTSYMALANQKGKVYTLEGAAEVANVAKQNFEKLQLENINLITGNFDSTLTQCLEKTGEIGLAFVDGNHKKEPTIRYFHQLLKNVSDTSIIVFDDVHWSREMEEAWQYIQQHSAVTLTIDLFFVGVVFFRKEQKVKQHFSIRY